MNGEFQSSVILCFLAYNYCRVRAAIRLVAQTPPSVQFQERQKIVFIGLFVCIACTDGGVCATFSQKKQVSNFQQLVLSGNFQVLLLHSVFSPAKHLQAL